MIKSIKNDQNNSSKDQNPKKWKNRRNFWEDQTKNQKKAG